MKKFWHVCTEGLAKVVIFKKEEDFIFGMNGVAVYSFKFGIKVLAFCLMDNHMHFILWCSEEDCRSFMYHLKRRLSAIADLKEADVYIKSIEDNEYLKRAICYVLRNPSVADRKLLPGCYRWGSGNLYFTKGNMPERPAARLSDLNLRDYRRILRTREQMPRSYTITEDGMVCPACYVCYDAVERLFGTSLAMLYFLARNESMEMELTEELLRKYRYTDMELAESVKTLCRQMFGREEPEMLTVENRCQLAVSLRKRYGVGVKQAARLAGIDPDLLKNFSR